MFSAKSEKENNWRTILFRGGFVCSGLLINAKKYKPPTGGFFIGGKKNMTERGEYLTYLTDRGLKTVEVDSAAEHPDESVVTEVLLGRMPVFRYDISSPDLHRYLDEARGHVLGCQEECKTFIEERRHNEY